MKWTQRAQRWVRLWLLLRGVLALCQHGGPGKQLDGIAGASAPPRHREGATLDVGDILSGAADGSPRLRHADKDLVRGRATALSETQSH